jgi:polyhydroxyalkanoate synthase subunit PhaE
MKDGRKAGQNNGSGFYDQWQAWYEKTCKPFFNIPQFGLTRYYQEHTYQAVDRYCQMQGTLAELLGMLSQPLQKSLLDTQQSLMKAAQEKEEIKDPKEFYTRWLSVLEKHYMELFRSPDYTRSLTKTMETLNDFMISRQTVLEDLMKMLPVPTHSDMDGLYKEFYELKKRVRDLEKEKVIH